ncbi:Sodium/hydrogen exchanger family-domain-containing protein [Xylariaceae sp. FL1019]|nr:Sodium/hydrogen exchanger family-domain-containing protein [Xylariaceae sp. FL1019]
MPTLDISELNIVIAVLGSFAVLFGLFAVKIKSVWYLGEALPAVILGIALGPISAKLLNPQRWGSASPGQEDAITLGVMRVMIGIQLFRHDGMYRDMPSRFSIGILMRVRANTSNNLKWRYKEISICLGPIMILMWLSTSTCIFVTLPHLPFVATLVIGACATSTDPILSQAVAKGPFADKYVARPLREIMSAEAGSNDGFASPFLMLAVNLMRLSARQAETLVERNRGVGPYPSNIGNALGNWAIETLVYIVLLATVYGAVVGFCARIGVEFSLRRKWIDTECYLLFPTALGLFIIGTCGAIGTSDLLACFVAGCALNWDGQFLAETERRHDEVNSCIDIILNFGGFMYVGAAVPWNQFNQPANGITYMRLIGLGVLVLFFRRIPALLMTYKAMPFVVQNWREALFMGWFGPIGVGAVYYLEHTRLLLDSHNPAEKAVVDALCPVVYFLVLTSILIHGLSIPILSAIYRYYEVSTITDDAVAIRRRSIYAPTPPNAFRNDPNTFIAYNRFFRPLRTLSMLPLAHTLSRETCYDITEARVDEKEVPPEAVHLRPVNW